MAFNVYRGLIVDRKSNNYPGIIRTNDNSEDQKVINKNEIMIQCSNLIVFLLSG